jgi:hypothetical protein
MKKFIFILIALIGFGLSAFAQKERFEVEVTTTVKYSYYAADENGNKTYSVAFTETKPGQRQTIWVCAENAQAARQDAISECKTMCNNSYKDEGKVVRNGKTYFVTSEKVVDDAVVKSLKSNC